MLWGMIKLHHLGKQQEEVWLNPDLIRTVGRRPDTLITLTDGHQMWVEETPEEIAHLILRWRAEVLRQALDAPATTPGEDEGDHE